MDIDSLHFTGFKNLAIDPYLEDIKKIITKVLINEKGPDGYVFCLLVPSKNVMYVSMEWH